jgi:serine/threonine protein phosphatase 1
MDAINQIQRYGCNETGRDFAVGDIHGHFTRLKKRLNEMGFDPERDRLFSVGDLIDRGPECANVLDWLANPWFHAIRGNHEDYVVRHETVDTQSWIANGGSWFYQLAPEQQRAIAVGLSALPIAMEVETAAGMVGFLHADCPVSDWRDLDLSRRRARDFCLWSRGRIQDEDPRGVAGIRAVVVGHTPLRKPAILGNVYHIDTGGWLADGSGHFTLLDLASLKTIPPAAEKQHFDDAKDNE